MRRRSRNRKERYYVSFGIGLLACLVLPTRCVVVLLAIALVACGLSGGKCG